MRAGKRLTKIKNWIAGNGIRTRADMQRKVAEDHKIAQNTRGGEAGADSTTAAEDDIANVRFTFKFDAHAITQNL